MEAGFDPNQITNLDGAHQAITLLLNLMEELKQENDKLRNEVQRLRDEINRLEGEGQGQHLLRAGAAPAQAATAKKLGVSFYAYIYDRVAEAYVSPSLADLIRQRAPAFHPLPQERPINAVSPTF